jgi:uncharacterized protein YebE (UPF0316 family)
VRGPPREGRRILSALVLLPLAVFTLKVLELTVHTIRTILAVSGMTRQAAAAGFLEAAIGITAMGAVVTNLDNPMTIVAYAGGFAVGIVTGARLEERLALGLRMVQFVNPDPTVQLAPQLRARGYRITSVQGAGQAGVVEVGLALVRRRSLRGLLAEVSTIAPRAFVTVERADRVTGGSFNAERPWWEWFRRRA